MGTEDACAGDGVRMQIEPSYRSHECSTRVVHDPYTRHRTCHQRWCIFGDTLQIQTFICTLKQTNKGIQSRTSVCLVLLNCCHT